MWNLVDVKELIVKGMKTVMKETNESHDSLYCTETGESI